MIFSRTNTRRVLETSLWPYVIISLLLLCLHAVVLHVMGRIPCCVCGFHVWTPLAWSSQTSQDFFDPYSLTHIEHGILFYWLLHKFLPKISIKNLFLIALLIEIAWEIIENSPLVINRYRSVTASLDYFGDSILNSVGDVLSCVLGFVLARRLPVFLSIILLIVIELLLLLLIRDNLTLNILMLFYPIAAIKQWQTAGLAL